MFGTYTPNYNPYYNYGPTQTPRMDQQFSPSMQNQYNKQPVGLQGKSVDSLEVVKAMDIPLDGSVSYFPLVDGTAIITKQLQADGTSKTVVYRPIEDDKVDNLPKYITPEELQNALKGLDIPDVKDLREDIKTLKRKLRDLSDDIKDKKEE